jgi:aerotaxis receptor
MKRPVPTGQEITFGFDELFFSTTNSRGVIAYGNDVFVRISGYEREQLIGKPHNVIRHPEMPKAVFKLLWTTIQNGRPIAAYVNNLAADGSSYWVMAVVFPCGERYLSIRLRPSGPFFETIRAVYPQLKAEESRGSLETSGALLEKLLSEAGYPNYQRFMTAALASELALRDNALEGSERPQNQVNDSEDKIETHAATAATLAAIRSVSHAGWLKFRELSSKMEEFGFASQTFQEMSATLLMTFKRIQVVSLNVTVFARQLGESAIALGVISKEFHRLAMDVERNTKELSTVVESILARMQESTLNLASLKLQMEMVDFFVRESLEKVGCGSSEIAEAFRPLENHSQLFSELSSQFSQSARQSLDELRKELLSFMSANDEIDRVIRTLEIITQMAALEAARVHSQQLAFASYLSQMENFNSSLKTIAGQIKHFTRLLVEILSFVEERLPEVTGTLDQILRLAFSLQNE